MISTLSTKSVTFVTFCLRSRHYRIEFKILLKRSSGVWFHTVLARDRPQMTNITGVGVIIENQDGEFLLHLRDGNTSKMPRQWCLVGGKIDEGEEVLNAAKREAREETNLTLINSEFVHTFKYDQWSIALVKGFVDSNKEELIKGEGADFQFVSREEVKIFLDNLNYSNAYLDQLKKFLS